jgi:hypothetical protein
MLESRSLFSTGKGLRSLLRRVKKLVCQGMLLSVYLEAGVKEPVLYREGVARYTHKTSGFKTSGFKTSGFKTSGTSGLQNVRFTKRQVYKMTGLQNVRSSKRPVAKKHP